MINRPAPVQDGPKTALYTPTLLGHRGAYLEMTSLLFAGRRRSGWQMIWTRDPAFHLMIEDGFAGFVGLAIFRALLRRRTVGLLFRVLPTLYDLSWRMRIKRMILKILRKMRSIRVISIVPRFVDPKIATICDDWIYDPQLWDLSDSDRQIFGQLRAAEGGAAPVAAQEFYARIQAARAGRRVMVSLGLQSREKGLAIMADAVKAGAFDDWLLVMAGRIAPEMQYMRTVLEQGGHLIMDRYITDEELIATYSAADAVWCLYDPNYDQASGILGRAVQLGVVPLVRAGSVSARQCQHYGVPHLAAQGAQDIAAVVSQLPSSDPDLGRDLQTQFARHSIAVLSQALHGGSKPL